MKRPAHVRILSLCALCLACALACRRGAPDPRRWVLRDVQLQPLVRHEFTLAAGAETTIEARGAAPAVPVLHLWDLAAGREVARDAGSHWLGRDARIAYRNAHDRERRYALVLRARDEESAGAVDLVRDGRTVQRAAHAAAGTHEVASGAGYVYDVAAGPSGPVACALYAFGEEGALLGVSDGGGRNGLPRLRAGAGVHALIAARSGRHAAGNGRVQIYANDPDDMDGDGLGRALERALRTCDAPDAPGCADGPLAAFYRSQPTAVRDSDRDGLEDGDELLGVVGAPTLDLPRYGADPRHKDVFVEVDRTANVPPPGIDGSDAERIAALFAQGSARSLKNPDGLPGVRLHLDLGTTPRSADRSGLYGDFGGSGVARHDDYKQARNSDFTPARRGYFRYALLTRWGTGQTSGTAFTVNRDFNRVPVFAHELAHTMGLAHHGHESWGKVNCKPNYYSLMNYLYQNREDVGFSRRTGAALDPSRVVERNGLAGLPAREVTRPPLEFDLIDGSPDWNRDGVISDEPVRAALTYATYKSCSASATARTTLFAGELPEATPALARLGDRLHALWIAGDGAIMASDAAVSGPDAFGSCPELAADPKRCTTWSAPARIAALQPAARHIAALPFDAARLALAIAGVDGQLQLAVLSRASGAWGVDTLAVVPQAVTDHAPALTWLEVDAARYGASRVLAIAFRARGGAGTLVQASAIDPAGPFVLAPLRDERARAIESPLGPSLVALGDGSTCGVFPDRERFIRFFCYEPRSDAFRDLSARAFYAGLGPRTLGTVSLAFHRHRTAEGGLVHDDPTRGSLYLSFSEPVIAGPLGPRELPFLLVSEWLAADHRPADHISFRWRFAIVDEWTYVLPGTGVALYEDLSLSALKAALAVRVGDALRIDVLPLADGTFPAQLGAGDDFEVMERGICRALRGPDRCGAD